MTVTQALIQENKETHKLQQTDTSTQMKPEGTQNQSPPWPVVTEKNKNKEYRKLCTTKQH
jgi:hypothetical protein